MECFLCHAKDFGVYSVDRGQLSKSFEQDVTWSSTGFKALTCQQWEEG